MSSSSISCLVVESDSQRAEQLISFLQSSELYDFLCYSASNLREAKRRLIESEIDIVISKGVMDEADHPTLLDRYRKNEYVPVVLCLLEDEEKSLILDTSHGSADDYLFYTDLSQSRIVEAIQHAFDRRELLSELKSVQTGSTGGKGVYRGLLHCLDVALFLVSRPDGEILFNNKVADAWFSEGKDQMLADLFEYGVLVGDEVELEIRTDIPAAPNAELRSVAVEWKGRDCSLITLRNISKRKRAEEAYRSSQRRLDLALKASNIGLWSWDLRSNQLHYSDRWKQQLGYSSNDFTNTLGSFKDHLHPTDREKVEEVFGQALRGEISEIELTYRMRQKSGDYRWLLCRAEIFPDESGKLSNLLGSHIDIADSRKSSSNESTETALGEKLASRLERIAAELEDNAVQLRTNFRGDSAIVERIQKLERLSQSVGSLNRVLQAEASKGLNGGEPVDLSTEISELCRSQRSLFPTNIDFDLNCSPGVRLYGFSDRALRLALTEALVCVADSVSRDFKNQVVISVGSKDDEAGTRPCPYVQFCYLGSLVREVEILALSKTPNLDVDVQVDGKFSVLKITFETDWSKSTKQVKGRPVALLAEDEGVLRLAIRTMLESLGFDVVIAADGAAAVEIFARRGREIDLALVDLQMPEIDGFGVMATIRDSSDELPIIRMSGDSNDDRNDLLTDLDEYSCFLSKPFGISDLKMAIESLHCSVRA